MARNFLIAGNSETGLDPVREAFREAFMGGGNVVKSFDRALESLEWIRPPVFITDLSFEGGLDVVHHIRSIDRGYYKKQNPHLRIVVLTESATREEIRDMFEAGVNDVVLTPFEAPSLRIRASYLARKQNPLRKIQKKDLKGLPEKVTQKDIDALVYTENALEGPDPYEAVKERLERSRKNEEARQQGKRPVIAYDWKHPSRVSKNQTRTLENLHSNLARMMASSFSTIQRSVVDVDIAFVDQTTYREFIDSLSNPSVSYTFTIEPFGGPAILDFSLPVAYGFIDRAFGGEGRTLPYERRPTTAIERTVMTRVVTRALADLEATWEPLIKVRIRDAELETNPEFMQVSAPSDTVVLIAFEVNTQNSRGLVSLCYPYFALEPVMSYLNVQTWASRNWHGKSTPERRQKRLDQLKTINVDLEATIGRGRLTSDQVAALKEGDTIVLDTRADDPGVISVAGQPVFLGHTGVTEKNRYGMEVLRSIPFEEVNRYVD